MSLKTETVSVRVDDGSEMSLFVARPVAETAPGIIVMQEAFGVNSHIKNVALRFAREGYLAVAPEFFHRTAPQGFTASYEDYGSIRPHLTALTTAGMEADSRAAFRWLNDDSQVLPGHISSIGYCMGGRASFIANSALPLRTAISYYGGGIAPELLPLAARQHGPLLLVWGGKDAHIGPEQRQAVSEALRRNRKSFSEITFGDADHGFSCDERKSYHPESAREAWALTLAFLRNHP